ncbi:site-2 protease family protein [Puniceicoccus vermicola]|uniref:Site-2 protease family protein n=1 Tax=Puniceicoccus vermicola TaxID=388746 RepID=A0A7X1E405_9BACT|nr:site-2 protease family protein [Puniceicoccus vermicola]MBC2601488.1 site-2 protease family protein [Puniceicoccus vermicola]
MSDINIVYVLETLLILMASASVHEWAHAWTAEKLGDPTARSMGRVTLNPIPHIDPIGTIILPLFFLLFSGGSAFFAWAKPVPVNPRNFRKPVRDDILVSMAGPASNLAIALLVAVVFGIVGRFTGLETIAPLAGQIILINALLMVFNLIPIPPLDGSHVLRHLIGMSEMAFIRFSQYGFFILIGLLLLTPFGELLWRGILFVGSLALGLMYGIAG